MFGGTIQRRKIPWQLDMEQRVTRGYQRIIESSNHPLVVPKDPSIRGLNFFLHIGRFEFVWSPGAGDNAFVEVYG